MSPSRTPPLLLRSVRIPRPDRSTSWALTGLAALVLVAALFLGVQMYLNPPTAGRWGVFGSYDFDLLELHPRPLVELTELLREVEETPLHLRLLRMGAVRHVLALHPAVWWRDLEPVATLPGLLEQPIRIFRVPEPLPRSYVVGGVRVADGRAAFEALRDPGFDPAREVILPEPPTGPWDRASSGTSRIVLLEPDRMRLEAELDGPGFVVLVDAYDPGWRAAVDGKDAPLLRANVAFRAVRVDGGRHVIDLLYRPRAVTVGLIVSAAALAAGAAAALRAAARAPS